MKLKIYVTGYSDFMGKALLAASYDKDVPDYWVLLSETELDVKQSFAEDIGKEITNASITDAQKEIARLRATIKEIQRDSDKGVNHVV